MGQSAAAWAIASLFGNVGPRPRPRRLHKPAASLPPASQNHLAREEARSLFQLVGKNGETVGSVRDLIGIDGRLERRLLAFIEWNRLDAPWVSGAMRYRALVLEEFNRLAKNAEPTMRNFRGRPLSRDLVAPRIVSPV